MYSVHANGLVDGDGAPELLPWPRLSAVRSPGFDGMDDLSDDMTLEMFLSASFRTAANTALVPATGSRWHVCKTMRILDWRGIVISINSGAEP